MTLGQQRVVVDLFGPPDFERSFLGHRLSDHPTQLLGALSSGGIGDRRTAFDGHHALRGECERWQFTGCDDGQATTGGVVERRWLNAGGYDPKDAADEGRIQNAVRAAPYLISVQN